MTFFAKSDTGKVRSNNQDSFFADYLPPIGKLCGNAFLAVVCDGMGGAAGGQIASRLAVDSFVSRLKQKLSSSAEEAMKLSEIPFPELLEDAALYANSRVYSRSKREPELAGMGTTLVACLIIKKNIYILNIGDSRLYTVKGDLIKQVTVDHSYVQSLVDMGSITPAEAEHHPDKNVITRAVGTRTVVLTDIFVISTDNIDMLILCSDGLSNMIPPETMMKISTSAKNVSFAVDSMITAANNAGGTDNITAALIKL